MALVHVVSRVGTCLVTKPSLPSPWLLYIYIFLDVLKYFEQEQILIFSPTQRSLPDSSLQFDLALRVYLSLPTAYEMSALYAAPETACKFKTISLASRSPFLLSLSAASAP